MIDCRLIIDPPASGAHNMAVDEALLIDASEHNTATLRFYSWKEPTLSLGYFQPYADREHHAASRNCPVVRRQTGGGAILHDRELTYSVILPLAHPTSKQNERLYQIVHEVFVNSLAPPDTPTQASTPLHIRSQGTALRPSEEPFLCFHRQSSGDVIFITQKDLEANLSPANQLPHGTKILGSAQRRYRGAVLQHGSLLFERSSAAPELSGLRDLASQSPAESAVISATSTGLATALGLRLHEEKLAANLESIAAQIANNKYGSPAWTKRR